MGEVSVRWGIRRGFYGEVVSLRVIHCRDDVHLREDAREHLHLLRVRVGSPLGLGAVGRSLVED